MDAVIRLTIDGQWRGKKDTKAKAKFWAQEEMGGEGDVLYWDRKAGGRAGLGEVPGILPAMFILRWHQTSPVADKTVLYLDVEFLGRVRPGAFDCRVAKSYLALCKPMDCSTHRLLWPSPSPRLCPSSCPLGHWCHPTISSSVVPFSSHLQSFPVSGSFPLR